jgi:acyl phosphate:glycerol-3-phosphate acyltransferase
VTELIAKGVLSYLLGAVVASLVLGRLRGVDIRTLGSGNAGATNALRTQGKAIGLTVLVIDLAKGWLASAWVAHLTLPMILPAAPALEAWSVPVCALAVMLGHIYPVWFGFRGGKGVATLVGVLLGISAALLLAFLIAFLLTVMLVGYVGLGSILGAVAVPLAIALGAAHAEPRAPLLAFAIAAALLILYTHRGNLERMRAGTESRARRLWLRRPRHSA